MGGVRHESFCASTRFNRSYRPARKENENEEREKRHGANKYTYRARLLIMLLSMDVSARLF